MANDPRKISGMRPLTEPTGEEWVEIIQETENRRVQIKHIQGVHGQDGKSAYDIALEKGFVGTKTEWLNSFKGYDGVDGDQGEPGDPGLSAYELAVANGFDGTEQEWLEDLEAKMEEPPNDGATYLRVNGRWVKAPYQLNEETGLFEMDQDLIGEGPYEQKIADYIDHITQLHAHDLTKEQLNLGQVVDKRFMRVNDIGCSVHRTLCGLYR